MAKQGTNYIEDMESFLGGNDGTHSLAVINGGSAGQQHTIDSDLVVIGRSEQATIRLDDSGISAEHCAVKLHRGVLVVQDLASTNGTFIDGERLAEAAPLPVGSILQLARTQLRHVVQTGEEILRERDRSKEMERAVSYVQALLPDPVPDGPVRTQWRFIPSAHLGGDAFGYHRIDADRTALYLLDVCGHGVGAALHSVSVINAIRRETLPSVNFRHPAEVLEALNQTFPMDDHDNLFLTIWYGVYDAPRRLLRYASAGHPPAHLVSPSLSESVPLLTKALPIGIFPDTAFDESEADVAPGSRLYIFSDGAYEVETSEGRNFGVPEFARLLVESPGALAEEPDRIEKRVRDLMIGGSFSDDFSLLCVEFEAG